LVVLVVGIAGAAQAQLDDVDTELTPKPRAPDQWTRLGGATFEGGGALFNGKDSATPFTVDFFSTSFSPEYRENPVGLFAGAECIDPETKFEDLADCDRDPETREPRRRPAVYRFRIDDLDDRHIERMELVDEDAPVSEQAGFVAAVAWLDGERALAVGGDGVYPRREPPDQGGDAAYAEFDREHWAGEARAWLYEDPDGDGDSEWRELRQRPDTADGEIDWESGDELPSDMGALTALDCASRDVGSGAELIKKGTCYAGGLQQLWRWRPAGPGDEPAEGFDSTPIAGLPLSVSGVGTSLVFLPVQATTPLPGFHFRVRQVRIPTDSSQIVAVTSGCCSGPDVAAAGARLIFRDGSTSSWRSEPFSVLGAEDLSSRGAPLADSIYSVVAAGGRGSYVGSALAFSISAIASPGDGSGVASAEPGSRILTRVTDSGGTGTGSFEDRTDRALDGLRLLAADGDYEGTDQPSDSLTAGLGRRDGMFDWAVGRFKESEQGVAYTTIPSAAPLPNPLTCKVEQAQEACDVDLSNVTDHDTSSKRLLRIETYALNAISHVPQTDGDVAWAAGDRGAIARLGGEGRLGGSEPDAPPLQVGAATPLSERGPFDPFRTSVGRAGPGVVPPLAERPLERLPARTLVPWGTADASRHFNSRPFELPTALAMSRDGSEGWAVGHGMALQHFDGERWARCDIDGLGGVYAPDPACESLRPLLDRPGIEQDLVAVARVPLERDGDPENDDEFAAIAVGGGGTMLRYENGRWEPDAGANLNVVGNPPSAQVAFRAPGDGWALTNTDTGTLHNYSGGDWPAGKWSVCAPSECGDTDNLLPRGTTIEPRGFISELRVAGDTVFVAGMRIVGGSGGSGVRYPFVLSRHPEQDEGRWVQEYDPGCPPPSKPPDCATPDDPRVQGASVSSLSVVDLGGGRTAGWVIGQFGKTPHVPFLEQPDEFTRPVVGPQLVLVRRDPSWERDPGDPTDLPWSPRTVDDDSAADLIPFEGAVEPDLVSVRGRDGEERSFITPSAGGTGYPPLEYDPVRDRWGVLRAPFVSSTNFSGGVETATQGQIVTAAPDERGGIWVAARSSQFGSSPPDTGSHASTFFYRYTDERRRPVFEDAPSPVSEPITDMAGTAGGEVWVSTESDRVYHYDQIAGWERALLRGWDRGRFVTRASHALAVAVNDAGVGILVGEDGRIADLSPGRVVLNPASGRRCSDVPPPVNGPCGTPRALRAAAVAPDGSAIAGGDSMALVWRPAGGQFRTIAPPRVPTGTQVTGVSMPVPGRAWITLSQGEIWAGTAEQVGDGWRWRWTRESDAEAARDERTGQARFARLYAIELQADGRGLAVGWRGAMLERSADGAWRRIKTGFVDSLHAIAFPPSGYGDGTIVGGDLGEILTRIDGRYRLARQTDFADPLAPATNNVLSGRIVGLTLAGGSGDGDVEAWAASQVTNFGGQFSRQPPPWALLHYGSGDLLVNPESRAKPLPDAPPEQQGELALAAFGRSECQLNDVCPPFQGTNLFNEVVTRAIQAELTERRARTGGPLAALFTGDINVMPGRDEENRRTAAFVLRTHTQVEANVAHDQWRELVARPLLADGIPTFAAVGKTDLSRARVCQAGSHCDDTQTAADAGHSEQWREAFAGMLQPWGSGEDVPGGFGDASDIEVAEVGDPAGSVEPPEQKVEVNETVPSVDPEPTPEIEGHVEPVDPQPTPRVEARSERDVRAGARTHYALDVKRDGRRLARLVFIDNSVARSLSASEGSQNPVEGGGGQAGWLEQVLCIRGETCAGEAPEGAREPGVPAVVVSNAPTYSYGPGGLDAVQADGSVLEGILLRHRVTAVVSGRLGWNGLYYTLGAGLHWPCPGDDYPDRPPDVSKGEGLCSQGGDQFGGAPERPAVPGAGEAADSLRGLGAPVPAQADDALGTADGLRAGIPTVVASTAGGKFGPRGTDQPTSPNEAANEGFWHGYSVLRVRGQGEVIVEQRPILDWVGIEAQEHTLRPGQRVTLRGYGREPYGTDTSFRGYRINSPAITHRYDLVLADPQKPYLPLEDANGDYVPVPAAIATVNGQTGAVRAGKGARERTYTIGILSVGDKAATWPLVFEPRRSFVPQRARITLPAIPRPARAPGAQPPLRIGDALAPPPTTPPATPASPLTNQTIQTPQPPTLPTLPGVTAAAPPPAPTLNAPPPPPPPPPAPPVPPQQQPQPLALGAKVQAVAIVPSVNPPAPPPVNPAPPGGAAARKEAKQRQAAVAKSEEGEGGEARESTGDLGEGASTPTGVEATRRAPDRPMPATRRSPDRPTASFSPLAAHDQPSAWSRGVLYGGGLGLAALAFTAAWLIARPRPRRRSPDLPAPAWARSIRR
jgi:hypothetical protein